MAAASLSYSSNLEATHDDDDILDFSRTSGEASLLVFPELTQLVGDSQLEASAAELLFDGSNNHDFLLPEPSSSSPFVDPFFNSGDFYSMPTTEYSFPQKHEFQAQPKRQKLHHHEDDNTQNCFGVLIPNPPLFRGFMPQPALSELSSSAPFPAHCLEVESHWAERKSEGGKISLLSRQSMAARERRRRITEKTQELGKLIPGGQKMNTADMFQAAYNYIKFLQAQLSVLSYCLSSTQENGETLINEEVEKLVGSWLIQEKLYTKDKCLVPEKLIRSLQMELP